MLKIKINGSKSEITYDMLDVSGIAYTDDSKNSITVSYDNHRLTDGSVVRFTRQGQNADAHENRTISVTNENTFVVDSFKPYEIMFEGMRIENVATGFDENGEVVYCSAFVLDLPYYTQFITTHDFDNVSASLGLDYYNNDEDDNSYKCPGDVIIFNGLVYKTDENELDEHNRYIFPNNPSQCLNYKEIDIIFYNELIERECVINGGIMLVDDYGNDINEHVYFFCERGSEDDTMLRNLMSIMPYVTIKTTDKRFYNDNNGELSFVVKRGIQESYIEKKFGDYCITIPIASDISTNTQLEDMQQQFLTNKVKESINNIVDFEKRQFEPVRYNYDNGGDEEYTFSDNSFTTIDEIVFNLHFRERYDEPNEGKEWATTDIDGWNNYYIGKDQSDSPILVPKGPVDSHNKPLSITDADLLKYLNFTDGDVYFQKSRLKKSFLRLLFYDSPDRGKQVLQYYSTIFFDTGDTFSKYVKAKSKEKEGEEHEGISDESVYYVSNEHVDNKDLRLCARFKTWSKNNMRHSSDGFYAYLFPSLIEGTLPSDLFLKIEFNHAKYGRTIPFILPTYEYINNEDNIKQKRILPIDPTNPSASGGNYFPIHYMKYDPESEQYSDVDFQKALDDMYINVKIKYDEKNNRYVWFLPRPKMDYEDDTQIVFNLFEPRLNGYEKLPSDTVYDNIPAEAIGYYSLNITLQTSRDTIDDFNFTASMDGEVLCQRVRKKDTLSPTTCQVERIPYTANVAVFKFLFEMTNSINHATAFVDYIIDADNYSVLAEKSLHGKYNTEITCTIDLSTMITNNVLNLRVRCTK